MFIQDLISMPRTSWSSCRGSTRFRPVFKAVGFDVGLRGRILGRFDFDKKKSK